MCRAPLRPRLEIRRRGTEKRNARCRGAAASAARRVLPAVPLCPYDQKLSVDAAPTSLLTRGGTLVASP
jgi:hypothetical protein